MTPGDPSQGGFTPPPNAPPTGPGMAPAAPPPPKKRSMTGLAAVIVLFGLSVICSIGVTVAYFLELREPEPIEGPAPVVDAGPPPEPDSGPPDSGPPDSGPPDAGPPDSGPPDSGPPPRPQGRGRSWWQNQPRR